MPATGNATVSLSGRSQSTANNGGGPRWAALDSRNERLVTAADSLPADADRKDADRELKVS